jgi:hypothetical protein
MQASANIGYPKPFPVSKTSAAPHGRPPLCFFAAPGWPMPDLSVSSRIGKGAEAHPVLEVSTTSAQGGGPSLLVEFLP